MPERQGRPEGPAADQSPPRRPRPGPGPGPAPGPARDHRTADPRRAGEAARRLATVAVGYCRRSTDRQEQSIPDQRRAIERFCEEKALTLLRWHIDDAVSGTSAAHRRGFQEMLAAAGSAARDFGVIVVYDVKRFGRLDNDEAGYYRHLLRTRGVEVLYASEGFTGADTDDLLRPVKQWQARQESRDLSKVTIRGLLSKAQSPAPGSPARGKGAGSRDASCVSTSGGGWWMGGVPPHGYDLCYENDRGEFLFRLRHMPDGSKLVLDDEGRMLRELARGESLAVSKRDRARLVLGEPSRVETVRLIFEMYAGEGKGLKAIADALNRRGVPTPRGPRWASIYAGVWRDSVVRAILLNPAYTGDMVWNRRTDGRFHRIANGRAVQRAAPHGARLVPNDECDWIVSRNAHPAIIARAVFEHARAIRTGRDASSSQAGFPKSASRSGSTGVVGGWTGARSRFALSGLIRCALCGARYQGVTRLKGTPRRDGTKFRTYSYACGGYIAHGVSSCAFNPIGQEALERAVGDAALKQYAAYSGAGGERRLADAVRAAVGLEARDLAQARERLAEDRRGVEASIARLLDSMTPATRDLVEERLDDLRRERKRLDLRGADLDHLARSEGAVADAAQEIAAFLARLEFAVRHGLPEERLTAFRRCLVSVCADKPAGVARARFRGLPSLSIPSTGDTDVEIAILA